MSTELAEVAHYVGVTTDADLQVFVVGCAAANCEKFLKGYSGLLVSPKFKVGDQVSRLQIEALKPKPNEFQKVVLASPALTLRGPIPSRCARVRCRATGTDSLDFDQAGPPANMSA